MGARTLVVKLGGEVVADKDNLLASLRDIANLGQLGYRVVICHGAGPQAGELEERLGMQPVKVGGLRVTDDRTLRVMKYVLAGDVSLDLVATAQSVGLRAVGLAAASDGTITATRRPAQPVDLGLVGEVRDVRPDLLEHLLRGGFTPVLNPLGLAVEADASVYNINADTVAAATASALGAEHLVLVTTVPGVLRDKGDPSTRIPSLTVTEARAALRERVVVGGMIPKVEEALSHLEHSGGPVHIVGAGPDVIAKAVADPGSVGTVLRPDPAPLA